MNRFKIVILLLICILAASAVMAQDEDEEETEDTGNPSTYTVEYGDTLDVIAQEFDISLVSLRLANPEIESIRDMIPGVVLNIPADAPPYGAFPALDTDSSEDGGQGGGVEGELYVVQPRDTLDTIAQEFDVSVISLQIANAIENNKRLMPGTTLVIPANAPAYGMFPALDAPDTSEGGGQGGGVEGDLYVMQPMDTIDAVAAHFGVATACIVEANEIANVRLVTPGTTIVIPTGCPAYLGANVPGNLNGLSDDAATETEETTDADTETEETETEEETSDNG